MGKTTPEILRELRKQKGATQSDIAKLLGFSTTAYQNYERGINEPSNKSLCILADFYGVTTDYLLGREKLLDPIELLPVGDWEKAILRLYITVKPEERPRMLENIKAITNGADVQLTISKPEIQKSETTQSSLVYCGTVGEELERRKREEEAIRKDTA